MNKEQLEELKPEVEKVLNSVLPSGVERRIHVGSILGAPYMSIKAQIPLLKKPHDYKFNSNITQVSLTWDYDNELNTQIFGGYGGGKVSLKAPPNSFFAYDSQKITFRKSTGKENNLKNIQKFFYRYIQILRENKNRLVDDNKFNYSVIEQEQKPDPIKPQKEKVKTKTTLEEIYYIEYLNKEKGFKKDRINFKTEKEAETWAKKNLEKFDPDMIRLEYKAQKGTEKITTKIVTKEQYQKDQKELVKLMSDYIEKQNLDKQDKNKLVQLTADLFYIKDIIDGVIPMNKTLFKQSIYTKLTTQHKNKNYKYVNSALNTIKEFEKITDTKIFTDNHSIWKLREEEKNEPKETDNNLQFKYQMLDRLKQDNEYFLRFPHEKHLWAGNVEDQIKEMKNIYNSFPKDKKPDWINMEDILEYQRKMSIEKAKAKEQEKLIESVGKASKSAIDRLAEKGAKQVAEKKPTKKIPLKNVEILWSEGIKSSLTPANFKTYREANKFLVDNINLVTTGGYDKTKFQLTFEDGETYTGRLDISSKEDNPTKTNNIFKDHILDFAKYYKAEFSEFIEKYDLNDKTTKENKTELEKGIQEEQKEHNIPKKEAEKVAKDHLRKDPKYYTKQENCNIGQETKEPTKAKENKRTSVKNLLTSENEFEVYLGVIYKLAKKIRDKETTKKDKFKITRQMNIIKIGYLADTDENKIKSAKIVAPIVRDIINPSTKADKNQESKFEEIYQIYKSYGNKPKTAKIDKERENVLNTFSKFM